LAIYKKNITVKCCKKSVSKDWSKDWHSADIPVAPIIATPIIATLGQTGSNLQPLSRDLGYIRTILGNALYDPCSRYGRFIAAHLNAATQQTWSSRSRRRQPKNGRIERGIGLYIAKSGNDTRVIKSRNVYAIDKAGARR